MTIRSAYQGMVGTLDRTVSAATRLGMDLAGGNLPGTPWHAALRPASFRGVPFAVVASDSSYGRRVSVHEYPYRDSVWVEDMGRAPRRISLVGFIVEDSAIYGGGDVLTQRDRLQRALEGEGEGELVHPTLGRKSVAVLRSRIVERKDLGRVFEIAIQVVEAGRLLYPGSLDDTRLQVEEAADELGLAAAVEFAGQVGAALKQGAAVVRQALGTVTFYARAVMRLVDDATNLYNAVRDLPGSFGRFVRADRLERRTTMTALKASTASRRAAVSRSGTAATSAAAALSAGTVSSTAAAIRAHVSTAAAALPAPADRMRLLHRLAASSDPSPSASSAASVLYRRAAVAELARAGAAYEPTSYDDAVSTRDRILAVIDAETVRAGDAGDDASYAALRRLRAAVAADLTARGASLARLTVVSTASPLPSLVLAQRLYQDADRADELVDAARPVHPAFMPTSFRALSE